MSEHGPDGQSMWVMYICFDFLANIKINSGKILVHPSLVLEMTLRGELFVFIEEEVLRAVLLG